MSAGLSAGANQAGPLLKIDRLSVRFGGLTAIQDLSFDVAEGTVVSLIGPNGAGKTSAFNAITGYLAPAAGDVIFAGTRLNGLKTHQIAAQGLVRTFQKTSVFGGRSALEKRVFIEPERSTTNMTAGRALARVKLHGWHMTVASSPASNEASGSGAGRPVRAPQLAAPRAMAEATTREAARTALILVPRWDIGSVRPRAAVGKCSPPRGVVERTLYSLAQSRTNPLVTGAKFSPKKKRE